MSDRERVEALAKVLFDHPRFGCGCCTYSEPCPTCDAEDYDFSPHDCPRDLDRDVSIAQDLLDSPAMRDLLAEAKADAGRDLRDYRAAYHRFVALAEQYDDDAAREPYGGEPWTTTAAAIRAAIDGDHNPYRETSTA